MFRILVVDDDPAGSYLLKASMQNVRHAHELHFAGDGVEALDFLHNRGNHAGAPSPHLILLDVNMPRLGGLETLSAIKSDPVLAVIPVIMLSTSIARRDVRGSYLAHAACYVEKPSDHQGWVRLMQAIEAFWMDFGYLPGGDDRFQAIDYKAKDSALPSGNGNSGPMIAGGSAEVRSQATMSIDGLPTKKNGTPSKNTGCEEHARLLDQFGATVRELLDLHQQQFQAISAGEGEAERFDILIHMANERKQSAKYAYIRHLEEHGCSKL